MKICKTKGKLSSLWSGNVTGGTRGTGSSEITHRQGKGGKTRCTRARATRAETVPETEATGTRHLGHRDRVTGAARQSSTPRYRETWLSHPSNVGGPLTSIPAGLVLSLISSIVGQVLRDMVDQFLGVTSGWSGVTITKFFSQFSLLNVSGLI